MAELQSLRTHLVTELKDLLDAEQQLTKVLPDFAARAATPALRAVFEHHLTETETHIERLKHAFGRLGESPRARRCEGMHGLIREGNAVVTSTPEGALRDAVMITSAQKVEHYEMASYGTARTYATVLGEPEVARLLEETLQDEKNADLKLTEIGEGKVNNRAAEEWHQTSAGLLEPTATLAGKAIGLGARTVKRAAGAVHGGQNQLRNVGTSTVVEQVTSSVNRAVEMASNTAGDVAAMARSQARRLAQPTRQASRKGPTTRNASRKGTGQKAKKRTHRSGGR
jgi:ferritin-like metal-binding protein YciE